MHINFKKIGCVDYSTTSLTSYCGESVTVRDTNFGYPTSCLIVCDNQAEVVRRGDWYYVQYRAYQSAIFANDEVTVFISNSATEKFIRDLCANELKGVVSYVN